MDLKNALLTCNLAIESNSVPLLIGESGIGKTSLVKKLAKEMNAHLIIIDANLLKEGEIGGLPTVEEYEVIIQNKNITMSGIDGSQAIRKKRTVYAIHNKLVEIEEVLKADPSKRIILLIDEINRCEHAVQQELMNLILNREINGYLVPENVSVIAAMNPSNKYNNFSESDYQVVDMDPAQEDRFVWIEMESDAKIWLEWGVQNDGKVFDNEEVSNVHKEILEFIASFSKHLHTPYTQESIKATPRSWERVSDSYRIYLKNMHKYPVHIFYNIAKGNVGAPIAQDFFSFLEHNKNPLLKPEEIFKAETLSADIINIIKQESHSRLFLLSQFCLEYISKIKRNRKGKVELFSTLLQYYPPDLKMAVMQDIKLKYSDNLYKDFMLIPSFVDGYLEIQTKIETM